MTTMQVEYKQLVNKSDGLISREIFVNEDIYQEEQERIFRKAWLYTSVTRAKSGTRVTSSFPEWERNL